MKPNQYVRPDHYNTNVVDENTGTIQFNSSAIRSDVLAATDPSVYVAALVEAAEDHLNGDDWREAAMEATPCEFRPAGTEATGQQILTMADRTVSFDPRRNWHNQTVTKGEALAGSLIFTETTDEALLISHRVSILDHNIQAGWTEQSLAQTADKLLRDIQLAAVGDVAKILAKSPSTEVVFAAKPTGKPVDVANDLIDLMAVNINHAVGSTVSDFVILIHVSLMATLERAAQRSGCNNIEELLGTSIQVYSGTDRGLFLLPKMFTSLSYREDRFGDIWRIQATRNPGLQAWDVEISTIVDILANGKVKVAITTDGLETVLVDYKLITNITFAAPTVLVAGITLKNASKDIAVGASYSNIATVAPANATNQDVTWTTSDASVATVSAAGSAKGLKVGKATITATTVDGGFSASYALNVTAS
ncbi:MULTISPECIES: Ig-like domain-containing protein [Pseudomonas syringae group]|jgi:hypothetical protein|uniref:Ig-like domain-containing protein n=1 Tax=Pseudomonas syringae group TaxID=136849 RepID=UPI0001CC1DEA|nr:MULTISPECIES: Ig-like domain-containing protein [Pseudomonas syringae group]KEZ71610.1 hypothetical protein C5I_0124375 [Pseudomonas syringae pv. syringae FF5]MBS7426395.1 Ig domain-containing protein [Pseudomonas syringae]MBS7437743.1 Ig domain-containing protein [Pseudomonas syringae]MBS7473828.1 Ig domain-containing protein [Pseudomonas syringae]QWB06942.1 Ig-like domain-containing protein [Pseudomonas syringae]